MNKLLFLFLLTFFGSRSFSQTVKTISLADKLLKPGDKKVAIISYEFPNDIKELQDRALKNLKANPQWTHNYIVRNVEVGSKTLSFNDAYGLTEQEFDKMLAGFKNEKKVIFKDTVDLKIQRINGLITFKAGKKLSAFNYLTIDTKKKQIVYDNYELTREVELTGQKNYAPILFGFESFWAVAIPGKKSKTNLGPGFSIGINSGDNRPTLCLILQSSISDTEYLIITIL